MVMVNVGVPSPKSQYHAKMVLPLSSNPGALNCTACGGIPSVGLAVNCIEGVAVGVTANTDPAPGSELAETGAPYSDVPYTVLPIATRSPTGVPCWKENVCRVAKPVPSVLT